jgi:hypothetical protein
LGDPAATKAVFSLRQTRHFRAECILTVRIKQLNPSLLDREFFYMNWIQSLLGFFYDVVFGCRHWSQTRPFTLEQQTYKVCLDCGKQIYYSTERMTPLSAREVRRMKAAISGPVTVISSPMTASSFFARRANKSNAAA